MAETKEKKSSKTYKQGTLRKKNSIFFKPEFSQDEQETKETLQDLARSQMRGSNVQSKKSTMRVRNGSMMTMRKGSFVMGSMEHKLSTMFDHVHYKIHEVNDMESAEKLAERKEKHEQDKQDYITMKQDPSYSKFKAKCAEQAKKDYEKFYLETEKELEEIEKLLGVDEVSLENLKKKVMRHMEEAKAAEAKKETKSEPAKSSSEGIKKEI